MKKKIKWCERLLYIGIGGKEVDVNKNKKKSFYDK